MVLRKQGEVLEQGISFLTEGEKVRQFYALLPFALTAAQQRVITEIERDMTSPRSMNRLLQGDVGSGKTAVSMAALITACENGHQAAIMAPTEILAEQHYRNLRVWAEKLGIKIALLTGGLKTAERRELQDRIRNGEIDLVVGTHALIQEGVLFRNLGLIVIDEQHRFGVVQRATLRKKGQIPDVLVMTATPIPRTLAMTVYGDLDISVIDEMPPGKIPVRTKVFSESQRTRVYEIIRREAKKGNQIFIVYPLVEASENLGLKDATRMAEHLREEIFPDCRVGLVHGRMKGKEKERVMNDFSNKLINILVSTTVIEVGIDIPEASLMVIEHAERFGLSQLHQLRGRVGRGGTPSFCILLTQKRGTEDARKRLRIMEQTNDGFRIAEEDLVIRGPGEFMGTRQSGLPDFRIASVVRDGRILGEARADAFALVEDDPRLEKADHPALREVLLRRWRGRLEMAKTG
jgi:ATP-dependent DNA helicase RecG